MKAWKPLEVLEVLANLGIVYRNGSLVVECQPQNDWCELEICMRPLMQLIL